MKSYFSLWLHITEARSLQNQWRNGQNTKILDLKLDRGVNSIRLGGSICKNVWVQYLWCWKGKEVDCSGRAVFFYLGSVITPISEFGQKKWSHLLLLQRLRKPDILTWVGAWQLECWHRTACQSHVHETLNLEWVMQSSRCNPVFRGIPASRNIHKPLAPLEWELRYNFGHLTSLVSTCYLRVVFQSFCQFCELPIFFNKFFFCWS